MFFTDTLSKLGTTKFVTYSVERGGRLLWVMRQLLISVFEFCLGEIPDIILTESVRFSNIDYYTKTWLEPLFSLMQILSQKWPSFRQIFYVFVSFTHYRTIQNNTEQYRTIQNNTKQYRTIQKNRWCCVLY